MSSHDHHEPPNLGDVAYEAFYSAAVGGMVVAFFFLAVDLVTRQPLYTPTLLGSVLFLGAEAEAVEAMNLTAVALFTIVHILGFAVLGFIATGLVRFLEERTGGGFFPPAAALFLLMEGSFLLFNEIVLPGTADIIGHAKILLANVLAAVAMTAFLRYAHGTAETELAGQAERGGE